MAKMENVYMKFNNGNQIPQIGLGTWKSEPGQVVEAVKAAIDHGYRHLDCAYAYSNEAEVGEGLKSKIDDGTVKREDIFITSKLWNTYHSKSEAKMIIKTTLENLKLTYLDLYLIHWPHGFQEKTSMFPKDGDKFLFSEIDFLETWEAMEEMVDEGLVKSIGFSNFNSQQIKRILDVARIKPVNLQVECHPFLNQEKLIDFCTKHDITVTAYSPLGSPDRPWAKPEDVSLLSNPIVGEIASAHGKSAAQVLIRFQVQRNVIVIPKSVTESRIRSNADVMNFELSCKEMEQLRALNNNHRFLALEWISHHPHFPFHIEF